MNPTELRAAVETVAQALERGEVPPLGKPAELADLINTFSRTLTLNPSFDPHAIVAAYAHQLFLRSALATPLPEAGEVTLEGDGVATTKVRYASGVVVSEYRLR